MKKYAVLLLTVIIIFTLSSCGGDAVSNDPNAGVYTATNVEMAGIQVESETSFPGGFTIELKDKGKCSLDVSGNKGNGKWSLEGSEFSLSGSGVEFTGTLENGVMTLANVMNTGMNVTLEKN